MTTRLWPYRPSVDGIRSQKAFRTLLVGNVRELAQLIPSTKVTCSTKIKKCAARLESLANIEPQVLRNDGCQCETTACRTEKILNKGGDFI